MDSWTPNSMVVSVDLSNIPRPHRNTASYVTAVYSPIQLTSPPQTVTTLDPNRLANPDTAHRPFCWVLLDRYITCSHQPLHPRYSPS